MRFFYFSLLSIFTFVFAADAKLQFFESKVRPILAENVMNVIVQKRKNQRWTKIRSY